MEPGIIMHREYWEYFELLTQEEKGDLLDLLGKWYESDDPEKLDELGEMCGRASSATVLVYRFIVDRASREMAVHDNITNRNRENGNKGGRPKKNQSEGNPEETQKNPEKTQKNPEKPKKTNPNPIPNPNPILPTEVKRESRERKAPTPRHAPTLEEVKAYAAERKSKVNPESFFLYHQGIGWKKGNNPIEDWKAIFQQWEVTEFDKGNPIRAVTTKKNGFHFDGERKTDYDAILREEQLALAEQIRAAEDEP